MGVSGARRCSADRQAHYLPLVAALLATASACGAFSSAAPTSTPTATVTITSTVTASPISTDTPTPSPIPATGGGDLVPATDTPTPPLYRKGLTPVLTPTGSPETGG